MRAMKGNCEIDLGRVIENLHFLRGIACCWPLRGSLDLSPMDLMTPHPLFLTVR